MTKMDNHEFFTALIRAEFPYFVEMCFRELNLGKEYIRNWHIDAMAHLAVESAMRINNKLLTVAIPPRSMKSTLFSVALVAYVLGHFPNRRIACLSYSSDLAHHFSNETRQIMRSDWYRRAFPNTLISPIKDTEGLFETTQGGCRYATTVLGQLTRFGFDIIIVDDSLKAGEAHLETARTRVNEWIKTSVLTRFNTPATGVAIVAQQRLHEDDLIGSLKQAGGWKHLDISAIAQEDATYDLGGGRVHKFLKGDYMSPRHLTPAFLAFQKRSLGSRVFAAHYLQEPATIDGGFFRKEWFQTYDINQLPEFARIYMSLDVAATENGGDFSAFTVWGYTDNRWYLLAVERCQLEIPDVRTIFDRLNQKYQPDRIVTDDRGLGKGLYQELNKKLRNVDPCPRLSSFDAAMEIAPMIEAGNVFIPKDGKNIKEFLAEPLASPKGPYCDMVDSTTQLLTRGAGAFQASRQSLHPDREKFRFSSKPKVRETSFMSGAGTRRLVNYGP